MSESIVVGIYLLGFAVSTAILIPWLLKTKKVSLGSSKIAAFILAATVSIAWPAAMFFLFLYRNEG